MQICHEHSRQTLSSTSDYRRFVVGALCIQCYPKMLKTTKRGNIACYFVIFVSVCVVLTMIIIANVDGSQEAADIDSAEVFDPAQN